MIGCPSSVSIAFLVAAVAIPAHGNVVHEALPGIQLTLPAEGRWSIATGWENGWPVEWHHAAGSVAEVVGPVTVYTGTLELPQGRWELRDAVRELGPGRIECLRRWKWTGTEPLDAVTLSIRWQVPGARARPFLPGISYYDNPAGRKVDAGRIPVIGNEPGAKGFYEEHRFPMPFALVEVEQEEARFAAALHSLPSPLRYGHYDDQWWSLGLTRLDPGSELALLSGAVASNGRNGVIKARQDSFYPYPDGYLTVPPGAVIEKRFVVELYPEPTPGSGFRPALRTSLDLFQPCHFEGFPGLADVIRRKFRDTEARWHEDPQCAGFDAFPDDARRDRPWIDLGWAGQSEAAAYPLLRLGARFGVNNAERMAVKSMDFISTAPFDDDGFAIRYDFGTHQWKARRNPLSQAQAIHNMLAALRVARDRPGMDTAPWAAFLSRACHIHADRILEDSWRPVSTNEGFLIAPLAEAASLFDQPRFLQAARKAADHYGRRHLSMEEPYWGGTLDARCEDKEGAWAALQGFLALYDATGESRYLDWAGHAADVILSYVYVWDVPLPPGRLADHALKTRGWTSVSVQNMHLDVYGVLCAPALWRLGDHLDRPHYRDLARLMVVTCGQLVDASGGQGEQLHQTHYAQHYDPGDLQGTRGDYVETWNVFWITAHFLNAAAQFDEWGVDWMSW